MAVPRTAVDRSSRSRRVQSARPPSMMPRPPGVIGITASTLTRPKATINASISVDAPNARRNTHSAAASRIQLAAAHPSTRPEQSAIAGEILEPKTDVTHASRGAIFADTAACGPPSAGFARHDPGLPSSPNTMPLAISISTMPAIAAVAYPGLTPRIGNRDHQRDPEDEVEHDCGTQTCGREREAGIWPVDPDSVISR